MLYCWRNIWNVAVSIPPVTVILGNRSSTTFISLGQWRKNPRRQVYRTIDLCTVKVNGKVHKVIRHEGTDVEQRDISTLSLTSMLDWGGWSTPCPDRWTPEKDTRYPLYRKLGGSIRVRKISAPPQVDPRTVQPVESRSFVRLVQWLVLFVGSQHVILRHVTFLAPRILGWLLDFCKFYAPRTRYCVIWHLISKAAFYTSIGINFPTSQSLLLLTRRTYTTNPFWYFFVYILFNSVL